MTQVLITIDTEMSALFHQRGVSVDDNLASSVFGRCSSGEYGINWQMSVLEANGLKGIFFVDPLPALVYGQGLLAKIVAPIVERGHEVQLHIHTEWLQWAPHSPVWPKQGRNLANFELSDQVLLLSLAADLLQGGGAPRPIALRAGNFGANDDSLRAAVEVGLAYDSSFNAGYAGAECSISLGTTQIDSAWMEGLLELPVAGVEDRPGHFRAAQVCALSNWEMTDALLDAARQQQRFFVVVTHSFEMLSRDRKRPNKTVIRRFERLCRTVGETPNLNGVGFREIHEPGPTAEPTAHVTRLKPHRIRTAMRIVEQAIGTWRYERRLLPV